MSPIIGTLTRIERRHSTDYQTFRKRLSYCFRTSIRNTSRERTGISMSYDDLFSVRIATEPSRQHIIEAAVESSVLRLRPT